jgi:AhpD family alkylhydroperoxidase
MDLLEYHEARGVRVGRTPTEVAEIAAALAR